MVNVGVGSDVTIRELVELVQRVAGFQGTLEFDTSKPDGTPRKLMDVGRFSRFGWTASTALETGLRKAYKEFQAAQG